MHIAALEPWWLLGDVECNGFTEVFWTVLATLGLVDSTKRVLILWEPKRHATIHVTSSIAPGRSWQTKRECNWTHLTQIRYVLSKPCKPQFPNLQLLLLQLIPYKQHICNNCIKTFLKTSLSTWTGCPADRLQCNGPWVSWRCILPSQANTMLKASSHRHPLLATLSGCLRRRGRNRKVDLEAYSTLLLADHQLVQQVTKTPSETSLVSVEC